MSSIYASIEFLEKEAMYRRIFRTLGPAKSLSFKHFIGLNTKKRKHFKV